MCKNHLFINKYSVIYLQSFIYIIVYLLFNKLHFHCQIDRILKKIHKWIQFRTVKEAQITCSEDQPHPVPLH